MLDFNHRLNDDNQSILEEQQSYLNEMLNADFDADDVVWIHFVLGRMKFHEQFTKMDDDVIHEIKSGHLVQILNDDRLKEDTTEGASMTDVEDALGD